MTISVFDRCIFIFCILPEVVVDADVESSLPLTFRCFSDFTLGFPRDLRDQLLHRNIESLTDVQIDEDEGPRPSMQQLAASNVFWRNVDEPVVGNNVHVSL